MTPQDLERLRKLGQPKPTPYGRGNTFGATLAGDASMDFNDSQAMVSQALAEKEVHMSAGQAERLLQQGGDNLSSGEQRRLQRIAAGKSPDKGIGEALLNTLDRGRQIITTGVADFLQVDKRAGYEITGEDWRDTFTGDTDALAHRAPEMFGDDGRLGGSALLRAAGLEERDDVAGKIARGVLSFAAEVLLDPTTYVTFGTLGLGKAAALKAAGGTIRTAGKEAAEAAVRIVADDAATLGGREALEAASREMGHEALSGRLARDAAEFYDEAVEEAAERFMRQVSEEGVESGVDPALRAAIEGIEDAGGEYDAIVAMLADRPEVIRDALGVAIGKAELRNGDEIFRLVSRGQWKTLEKNHAEFVSVADNFATGGMRLIGSPLRTKNLAENRVSRVVVKWDNPFRGQHGEDLWKWIKTESKIGDTIVGGSSRFMESMSTTKSFVNAARNGTPEGVAGYKRWRIATGADEYINGARRMVDTGNVHERSGRPIMVNEGGADLGLQQRQRLNHQLNQLNKRAADAGIDPTEASKHVSLMLGTQYSAARQYLLSVPESIRGQVEQTYWTFRDELDFIAREMRKLEGRIGVPKSERFPYREGYFPLAQTNEFIAAVSKIIDNGLPLTDDVPPELEAGMNLLFEMIGQRNGNGAKLVQKLASSKHALHRETGMTMAWQLPDSPVGMATAEAVERVMGEAVATPIATVWMSEQITLALKHIVDKMDDAPASLKALVDTIAGTDDAVGVGAFNTNLASVIDGYMETQTAVLRSKAVLAEAREVGAVRLGDWAIDSYRVLAATTRFVQSQHRESLERLFRALEDYTAENLTDIESRQAMKQIRLRKGRAGRQEGARPAVWIELPEVLANDEVVQAAVRQFDESQLAARKEATRLLKEKEAAARLLGKVPNRQNQTVELLESEIDAILEATTLKAMRGLQHAMRSQAVEQADTIMDVIDRAVRTWVDEVRAPEIERDIVNKARKQAKKDAEEIIRMAKDAVKELKKIAPDEVVREVTKTIRSKAKSSNVVPYDVTVEFLEDLVEGIARTEIGIDVGPLRETLRSVIDEDGMDDLVFLKSTLAFAEDSDQAVVRLFDEAGGGKRFIDVLKEQASKVDGAAVKAAESSEAAAKGALDVSDPKKVLEGILQEEGFGPLAARLRSKRTGEPTFMEWLQDSDRLGAALPTVKKPSDVSTGNWARMDEKTRRGMLAERIMKRLTDALEADKPKAPKVSKAQKAAKKSAEKSRAMAVNEIKDTLVRAGFVPDDATDGARWVLDDDVSLVDTIEMTFAEMMNLPDTPMGKKVLDAVKKRHPNASSVEWKKMERKIKIIVQEQPTNVAETVEKTITSKKTFKPASLGTLQTNLKKAFVADGKAGLTHRQMLERADEVADALSPQTRATLDAVRDADGALSREYDRLLGLEEFAAETQVAAIKQMPKAKGQMTLAKIDESMAAWNEISGQVAKLVEKPTPQRVAYLRKILYTADGKDTPLFKQAMRGMTPDQKDQFRNMVARMELAYDTTVPRQWKEAAEAAAEKEAKIGEIAGSLDGLWNDVIEALDDVGRRQQFEGQRATNALSQVVAAYNEIATYGAHLDPAYAGAIPNRGTQGFLTSMGNQSDVPWLNDDEFLEAYRQFREGLQTMSEELDLAAKNVRDKSISKSITASKRQIVDTLKKIEPTTTGNVRIPTVGNTKDGFYPIDGYGLGVNGVTLDVHNEFAAHLNQLTKAASQAWTPEAVGAVSEGMRWFQRYWKAQATIGRPTKFLVNNLIGGIWNGTIAGVGAAEYRRVGLGMTRFRKALREFGDWDEAVAELAKRDEGLAMAVRVGVADASFSETELRHLFDPKSADEVGTLNKINPFDTENFFMYRLGARGMEATEDYLRAATFIRWYDPKDPNSWVKAKGIVDAIHFDYSDLSKYEETVKKVFPFFVWTRRNVPLQFRTLIEQPRIMTRYIHMMHAIDDQTEDPFDGQRRYANGISAMLGVDEDEDFASRLMFDPRIPVTDLLQVFDAGLSPTAQLSWIADAAGPWVTEVFDAADPDDWGVNAPLPIALFAQGLDDMFGTTYTTTSGDVRMSAKLLARLESVFPLWRGTVGGLMERDPRRLQRVGITDSSDPMQVVGRWAQDQLLGGTGIRYMGPNDVRSEQYDNRNLMNDIAKELKMKGLIAP